MNAIDKAIESAGGLSALAERLKVKPNRVNNWRSRGVPIDQCVPVERATEGEVTRRDLRPDDWEQIWPELADAPRTTGADRRIGKDRRSTDKKT